MSDGLIVDLLRAGLWTATAMATPLLIAALTIGLVVSVLQALTQVNEMTLTFVPKLAAMGAVMWATMDFTGRMVISFYTDTLIPLIAGG